ncbi:hypothetical protein [Thermoflexibacter ruber]|uniref:Uncharacterized protein n=1 Tax=Thermoflexibacter ruber TaxID=1003 RepID=A0A1I2IWC6_9BACT|nr:hypothetical protein [Thermoflexibacter ruber]SFF46705.1 hypothetical protein SAMN04488541_10383 [Thermoflexibacter ruber]
MEKLSLYQMTEIKGGSLTDVGDIACAVVGVGDGVIGILAARAVLTVTPAGATILGVAGIACGAYAISRIAGWL